MNRISEVTRHWRYIWSNAVLCALVQASTAPLFGLPVLSWRVGLSLAIGGWWGHIGFTLMCKLQQARRSR